METFVKSGRHGHSGWIFRTRLLYGFHLWSISELFIDNSANDTRADIVFRTRQGGVLTRKTSHRKIRSNWFKW